MNGETLDSIIEMLYNRIPHHELVEFTDEWEKIEKEEDEENEDHESERCWLCDKIYEGGDYGWRDSNKLLHCWDCRRKADNYDELYDVEGYNTVNTDDE